MYNDPLLPDDAAPVLKIAMPLAAAAFAVCNTNAPLVVPPPTPEITDKRPPVATDDEPAISFISPPDPLLPDPTVTYTEPPRPFVAAPEPRYSAPLLPDVP
tara:strand:+ start:130 stop:432 length:303 start_codon:yes stop_codon:yes gene_type:complete